MEAITPNTEDIECAIKTLIRAIGEDPEREGLKGTPDRIMRMFKEIFRGYDESQKPKITTFENEEGLSDIVFDKGNYYSMCEHHLLPFVGKAHIVYIPGDGKVIGLSKLARIVNVYAQLCAGTNRIELFVAGARLAHPVVLADNGQEQNDKTQRHGKAENLYGRIELVTAQENQV